MVHAKCQMVHGTGFIHIFVFIMKTKLDLNTWNRKDHFEFFRKFDEPFYNLSLNVDCTPGLLKAKAANHSLFAWYLFSAMKASNMVKEFRYRIEGEEVYEYDIIHVAPTIFREDQTFGFGRIDYQEDFEIFQSNLQDEIDRVKGLSGLFNMTERPDTIHYSVLPWFSFTGLSHPRNYGDEDSIPKITFGKIFEQDQRSWLPLSVHVHHAVVDGCHVNEFVEAFQGYLNS